MAEASSSSSKWPAGKIGIGKTLPHLKMVNPSLENPKDPWAAQYLNKLQNGFHSHMKHKAYVQQLSAHLGSLGDSSDPNAVGYAAFVNIHPDEMKPGAVAMGDAVKQKAIFESLKAIGIEEPPAKEQNWQKSVVFPLGKESAEGPLSHKPEDQGIGFLGSTNGYCKKWLESAKHFTAHRFRKRLEEKKCRT